MPKIICCSNKNDTINMALNDTRMSLKAIGLLMKLMSYTNKKVTRNTIENELTDGKTSIATAFKELDTLGYLKMERNVLSGSSKIEYLYKIQCPNIFQEENQKYLVNDTPYQRVERNGEYYCDRIERLLELEKIEFCEIYVDNIDCIKKVLLVYNLGGTNKIDIFSYEEFSKFVYEKYNIQLETKRT